MILAAVAAEAPVDPFTALMTHVAQGFEALGAAILVAGDLAVRARSGNGAAVGLDGQGLPGVAPGLRRRRCCSRLQVLVAADLWFARTGLSRESSPQCPGARADRGHQDVPEFLARGDGDRGRRAVAASPDQRRGDHPPGLGERAGVRRLRPDTRGRLRRWPQPRPKRGSAWAWPTRACIRTLVRPDGTSIRKVIKPS